MKFRAFTESGESAPSPERGREKERGAKYLMKALFRSESDKG